MASVASSLGNALSHTTQTDGHFLIKGKGCMLIRNPTMHLRSVIGLVLGLCLASSGIKSGKASDFYISSLPALAADAWLPEIHSGLIEVGSKMGLEESSLFFWHTRAYLDTQTTIIWFNGGPGCSSMDGNLLELGPLRVRHGKDGSAEVYNSKGTWAEAANLLFIDQPFGTGFSDPNEESHFVDTVEKAAQAVALFLIEYSKVFPEVARTKIILAGESFAGHYVPQIFDAVQSNHEAWESIGGVDGMILGNPWLDPATQYASTLEFVKAYDLLDSDSYKEAQSLFDVCISDLQAFTAKTPDKSPMSIRSCEQTINYISRAGVKDAKKCLNLYDYTLESPIETCGMEWPYELDVVTEWLSRGDVLEALHVPHAESGGGSWRECNSFVHRALLSSRPIKPLLSNILSKIPVMLMIGDNDILCNGKGQDRMVQNLDWNGHVGFKGEPTTTSFGTWQSERNLTVAHIDNSSHMVPYDQLQKSREVLNEFLQTRTAFGDLQDGGGTETDEDDDGDVENTEEINRAMYRAYAQAGVVALVVVLIVTAIFGIAWWRSGQGIGCMGFVHALLQSGMKVAPKKRKDYVPLRSMRRPEVIIEEGEEGLEEA